MALQELGASTAHDPGKRDLERIRYLLQARTILFADGDRSSDNGFFSLAFGHSCTVLNSGAVYFRLRLRFVRSVEE
jgi:hypothetical protein